MTQATEDAKAVDMRFAVLCEPDGTPVPLRPVSDGTAEAEEEEKRRAAFENALIPSSAYGRRVRAVRLPAKGRMEVARVRLDETEVQRSVGCPPKLVEGTARSGQRCIMISGPNGRLVVGAGWRPVSRRTVRMMQACVRADGGREVSI